MLIYNWWSPRVSNPAKDPNLGQRVYKTPLNTCSDDLIKGWWSWRDSNPRLLPCKGSTLPLSYSPTLFTWSGLRDSNSYQKLGRLLCYRWHQGRKNGRRWGIRTHDPRGVNAMLSRWANRLLFNTYHNTQKLLLCHNVDNSLLPMLLTYIS